MADTDARDKLRSMGGIMSSSPELMRAVERAVEERLSGRTFAPGYDLQTPTMRSAVREEGLDYPSYELLRRATPSRQTLQALGYPESSVGGQMYFDRMLTGMGLADPDKKMPPYDTSLGSQFRTQPLERPNLTNEEISRREAFKDPDVLRKINAMNVAELSELPVTYRDDVINEMRRRKEARDAAGGSGLQVKQTKPLDFSNLGRGMPSGPPDRGRLGRETRAEEEPAKTAADAAIDKKMNADAAAPKELAGRIADATERQINDPEPKSKKDLRSRYKENLALYKELYGIDDEDRARDKMMSLAMIGLAIAAGQSPNALTNIAQGALTGLKSMSESAAERRQQDRDLRTAALEAALGDIESEREAQADVEAAETEFERDVFLKGMELSGKSAYAKPQDPEQFRQKRIDDTFAELVKVSTDPLASNTGLGQMSLEQIRQLAESLVDSRAAPAQATAEAPAAAEEPVVVTTHPDPRVEQAVKRMREANRTDEEIKAKLTGLNYPPEKYGF